MIGHSFARPKSSFGSPAAVRTTARPLATSAAASPTTPPASATTIYTKVVTLQPALWTQPPGIAKLFAQQQFSDVQLIVSVRKALSSDIVVAETSENEKVEEAQGNDHNKEQSETTTKKRYGLYAHKNILGASSGFFAALFTRWEDPGAGSSPATSSTPSASKVNIEEEDMDVFMQLIYWMYAGRLGASTMEGDDFFTLLVLANKYEVLDLLKILCAILEKHLLICDPEFLWRVTLAPELEGIAELRSHCLAAMAARFQTAVLPSFQNLRFADVIDLLNRDDLSVRSEYTLFCAATEWIKTKNERGENQERNAENEERKRITSDDGDDQSGKEQEKEKEKENVENEKEKEEEEKEREEILLCIRYSSIDPQQLCGEVRTHELMQTLRLQQALNEALCYLLQKKETTKVAPTIKSRRYSSSGLGFM